MPDDLDPTVNIPESQTQSLPPRRLSGRRLCWPALAPRRLEHLPYTIRPLRDDARDFEGAAEVFRRGYPQLFGTGAQGFLVAETYRSLLGEGAEFMAGRHCMLVAADEADTPVAALYLKGDPLNLSVFWALAVAHPDHRRGLLRPLAEAADGVTAASGAEYAYSFAVTFHRMTQRVLHALGFEPRGVLPGAFISWSGDDLYHRETVVYMDKLYAHARGIILPDVHLIPEARRLL